ncbi:hypothetical protein BDN67DRAFT_982214 [Paxillus ammoniavirescens]|nr:hypothetical protein BDN67DRAFT_982214 [Paxillus ammoniavirescens]
MPSDLSNSPSSELPTTVGSLEPPCTPAIDTPMTTPRVHSPSQKATWGKQEGSISEQSKSKYPETTCLSQAGSLSADGNLQLWYHRMVFLSHAHITELTIWTLLLQGANISWSLSEQPSKPGQDQLGQNEHTNLQVKYIHLLAKEVYHWKRACTTEVNLEQDPHHAGSSQPEAEATPQHATSEQCVVLPDTLTMMEHQQPQRLNHQPPLRFRDVLPEPPLPLPPAGLNVPSKAHLPLRSSPSVPGDCPARQRIETQQNKFGIFRIYDMEKLPSHDPEDLSSILPPVLQNRTSPMPNDNNPFHPYPNENSLLLGNWYWNHGSQKSRETFKQLLEIVGSPNF